MLLLTTLDSCDAGSSTATVPPLRQSLCFSEETEITTECFVELMAQTMAAAYGYAALCSATSAKTCYIVGIEKFEYHPPPTHKSLFDYPLRTWISEDMVVGAMKVMQGKVLLQNTLIAQATIKVFVEPAQEERNS